MSTKRDTGGGSGVDVDPREFYPLWLVTVATYGFGDVVTTLALVDAPHAREANVVVAAAIAAFGGGGFAALKIAALWGCVGVSAWAADRRSRLLYYLPPFLLSIVGTVATVHNAGLLVG